MPVLCILKTPTNLNSSVKYSLLVALIMLTPGGRRSDPFTLLSSLKSSRSAGKGQTFQDYELSDLL